MAAVVFPLDLLIAVKLPPDALDKLEEIRERLRDEQPGVTVSRSDALRRCIYSLSADFRMRPLLAETAKDSEKKTGRKGKVKGG